MIVLDSDHLRFIMGPRGPKLQRRLIERADPDVVTTVVNVAENFQGWLAEIHRTNAKPES